MSEPTRLRGRWDTGGAREMHGNFGVVQFSPWNWPGVRWGRLGLTALLVVGAVTLNLALTPAAHAAGLTVTDCSSANASATTLNLDTAVFDASFNGGTITFSCSGDLKLDQTLTITSPDPSRPYFGVTIDGSGQSVTLDGGGAIQPFVVDPGASLTLNNLTIANGKVGSSQQTFPAGSGGGLENNGGTVNITNTTFSNNSADGQSFGGGLVNANLGTVNITNSIFVGNSGGIGGGLYDGSSGGPVTITNSAFSNNVSNDTAPAGQCSICIGGGGVGNAAQNGTLTITNSTFDGNSTGSNSSTPYGGGLANDAGTVRIINSEFDGNMATQGGNIYNLLGTVNVTSSTINGQLGVPNRGSISGLDNENGTATITNSTFFGNVAGLVNQSSTATITNSDFSGNGTGLSLGGGPVSVVASIIVGNINSDGACSPGSGAIDQGYNLIGGVLSAICGFNAPTDIQPSNPQIATNLANNGGPTQTLALLAGSLAIDAAPCPTPTDQRGAPRPDENESLCDIGAYEFQDADTDLALTNMPANITVNATSVSGAVVTYTAPSVVDGDFPQPAVSCDHASGATFPIGVTTVTCTVTDTDDTPSSASAKFTVTVNDTDLGLSNVPTNITVSATSVSGAVVTYTPPTAIDESGDTPAASVSCDSPSGSTFPIGVTTVTCTANDSDDTPNSVRAQFTVTVNDTSSPTLQLPSTITASATSPGGAVVTYSVTATDPDNAASDVTVSCAPASGSLFPIGATTVSCTATDPFGNSNSGSFQVVVTNPDTDLALTNVPGNMSVNATSASGAVVTYTSPTVVDEDSPLLLVSCDHASGSTFPIGSTTVTCTVSDSDDANSPVSASFTVKVIADNDLALANVPANITVNAASASGVVVKYALPTVADEDSLLPLVSCDHASGATFPIGVTTVTCTVSDSDDLNSPVKASFQVLVKGPVQTGAGSIGFWQGKNGQAILSGGAATSGVCNSATWLQQYAPFQDLSATASCSKVASYVASVLSAASASKATMAAKLKAQMLVTALDVYFSDPTLGGNKLNAPAPIGGVTIDLTYICQTLVSTAGGAPSCAGSYANASSAFGGSTSLKIAQMLSYVSSQFSGGVWYGGDQTKTGLAKGAFEAINNVWAFAP